MIFNRRRPTSAVLIFLFIAGAVLVAQPAEKSPASFGFAFNFKKGQAQMQLGVCAVPPGAPAAAAGVRLDDLITAMDGNASFKNAFEVLEYLSQRKAGDELRLEILRNDHKLTLRIVAAVSTQQQQARMKRNLELAREEADQDLGEK